MRMTNIRTCEYNTGVDSERLRWRNASGQSDELTGETHLVEITCAPLPQALQANLTVGADDLGPPTTRLGSDEWRWEWRPRGRVGRWSARLTTQLPNNETLVERTAITVSPSKLQQRQYEELLRAIQRVALGLVYALGGGATPAELAPTAARAPSLLEHYWTRLAEQTAEAAALTQAFARRRTTNLRLAHQEAELATIHTPSADLVGRFTERPLDEASVDVDMAGLSALPRGATGKPLLPRTVPVSTPNPSADVPAHRLLVRVLHDLHGRCAFVREELAREARWRERAAAADALPDSGTARALREWRSETNRVVHALNRCTQTEFLAGIRPATTGHGLTPQTARDPLYRRVQRLWRAIRERPLVALESPGFDMPVGDVPTLYEQWCLLEVARALGSIGTLVEQQLLESERPADESAPVRWRVRIAEDRPLLRRRLEHGTELSLWYRRRFRPGAKRERWGSLDPYLRVPDIVIEIKPLDACPTALVFDAKYRVTPGGDVPEDALSDAYAYHAAIGYDRRPASAGVFLLFPGDQGFVAGAVGALPFAPGQTDALDELLRARLS